VTLILRHTDPITAAISTTAMLIGGVFYPVDLLPETASRLAYMFPLAPSLEALRRILFAGASVADVGRELAVLALFAALVGLAGVSLFSHALRRARADGSLSHY